jgi:hypothetical protein
MRKRERERPKRLYNRDNKAADAAVWYQTDDDGVVAATMAENGLCRVL